MFGAIPVAWRMPVVWDDHVMELDDARQPGSRSGGEHQRPGDGYRGHLGHAVVIDFGVSRAVVDRLSASLVVRHDYWIRGHPGIVELVAKNVFLGAKRPRTVAPCEMLE